MGIFSYFPNLCPILGAKFRGSHVSGTAGTIWKYLRSEIFYPLWFYERNLTQKLRPTGTPPRWLFPITYVKMANTGLLGAAEMFVFIYAILSILVNFCQFLTSLTNHFYATFSGHSCLSLSFLANSLLLLHFFLFLENVYDSEI